MPSNLLDDTAVWFEVPVIDFERAKRFYGAVLGTPLEDEAGGPNPMAQFPGADDKSVRGHIYPGTPAPGGTGPTVHLGVAELQASLARVAGNGGEVVSPVIEIPAGRFAYCLDPDGNSFGLFTR